MAGLRYTRQERQNYHVLNVTGPDFVVSVKLRSVTATGLDSSTKWTQAKH
jgi:hypothetical protein